MSRPARLIGEIESPCIGICTLGPGGFCAGCFRTAKEIAGWLNYSPEQRRAIMERLDERSRKLFDDD